MLDKVIFNDLRLREKYYVMNVYDIDHLRETSRGVQGAHKLNNCKTFH